MIIEEFKKDLKDLLDKFHKESGGVITELILDAEVNEHLLSKKEVSYEIFLKIE